MQDKRFTDEQLVAFLDGENDHAPVQEIAEALTHDTALAARVKALRLDTAGLALSYASLLKPDSAPPQSKPVASGNVRQISLAASVALVAGIAIGSLWPGERGTGWRDYVAAYQALYATSTLVGINSDEAIRAAELVRVGTAISKSIELAQLEAFPEAEYKRAQLLSFEGNDLVQLAFLTKTGEPLALCIIRSDKTSPSVPVTGQMENMQSAHWSDGSHEYLLIGGTDEDLIGRMAAQFASMGV
ncbi:hypothetical protein [uncultured Roseobacter sp.]|uniref:anti-sigma factor family protein n=1 Tax=uncultured Roseobacter sp. TaxID=114847 RepID=UPI00262CF1CC|nr:hypothetical protein [uncultured Roseobacter sp.]